MKFKLNRRRFGLAVGSLMVAGACLAMRTPQGETHGMASRSAAPQTLVTQVTDTHPPDAQIAPVTQASTSTASTRAMVETKTKLVNYTVMKRVYEDHQREVTYTVMKPVYETREKTVTYTVCKMVPEVRTKTVNYRTCKMVPEEQQKMIEYQQVRYQPSDER